MEAPSFFNATQPWNGANSNRACLGKGKDIPLHQKHHLRRRSKTCEAASPFEEKIMPSRMRLQKLVKSHRRNHPGRKTGSVHEPHRLKVLTTRLPGYSTVGAILDTHAHTRASLNQVPKSYSYRSSERHEASTPQKLTVPDVNYTTQPSKPWSANTSVTTCAYKHRTFGHKCTR